MIYRGVTIVYFPTIISEVITGIQHLDNAVTYSLQWAFSIFGPQLPNHVARAIVILVSVIFLLKFSGMGSEVIMTVVVVLIIATRLWVQLSWNLPGV
jgi:hypothetical protein